MSQSWPARLAMPQVTTTATVLPPPAAAFEAHHIALRRHDQEETHVLPTSGAGSIEFTPEFNLVEFVVGDAEPVDDLTGVMLIRPGMWALDGFLYLRIESPTELTEPPRCYGGLTIDTGPDAGFSYGVGEAYDTPRVVQTYFGLRAAHVSLQAHGGFLVTDGPWRFTYRCQVTQPATFVSGLQFVVLDGSLRARWVGEYAPVDG